MDGSSSFVAGGAGCRTGSLAAALCRPVAVETQPVHDIPGSQISVLFQPVDAARVLRKQPVTDGTFRYGVLMSPVRKRHITETAAGQGYDRGPLRLGGTSRDHGRQQHDRYLSPTEKMPRYARHGDLLRRIR